jgi:Ser/Thr protein kinase RdoA (MazF antagonist)
LDHPGARELLGRTLARIHAVGAVRRFQHRPSLELSMLGARARKSLLKSSLLPAHMRPRYEAVSAELLREIASAFAQAAPLKMLRVHGDCHLGNILWQARGPLFVDLDDCLNAPRIQDLWMFLSGTRDEQRGQWAEIVEGYRQFGSVDYRELSLVEPLRALRMLNHAAWVAERWQDPAFPRAFPWAAEARYWEGYVGDLAEQCSLLTEPPVLAAEL